MLIDVSRFKSGGEKERANTFISIFTILKTALENRQFNFLDPTLYINNNFKYWPKQSYVFIWY